MPFFVILALNLPYPAQPTLTNMHPNPVSSFVPAGGTIGCDLQKIIAMLNAIADDQPVTRLHISEKTAQTHLNIKAKLNAQFKYDITQFAQAFDLI
jgi:hypothetical protein